jgi:hypothetical protein
MVSTLLLGAFTLGLNRQEHGEWDWAVAFEDTCVGKEEGRTYHRDGTLGSVVLGFWSGVSGRRLSLSVFHVFNEVVNARCCSSGGDFYCVHFKTPAQTHLITRIFNPKEVDFPSIRG